jgi:membrane-bound metal-dependent hydrolase YbcI (DUF457 family)
MRILGHIKVSLGLAVASFSLGSYMGYDYLVNLTLAISLAIGSIAPDFTEFGVIKHRTYTHYPPFYIAIIFASYYYYYEGVLTEITYMVIMGYAVGSLVHILCDWPYYRGIPLLFPTKQVKLFGLHFNHTLNLLLERIALVIIGITAVSLGYNA